MTTRHVRVTVAARPARPWWVLPMPHVHGLVALFVLPLWFSIAACWYPVVLGSIVLKCCYEGVMAVTELITNQRADVAIQRHMEDNPTPAQQAWREPSFKE